jgi:hypothetical protein
MDRGSEENAAVYLARTDIVSIDLSVPCPPTEGYRSISEVGIPIKHILLLPKNRAITRMMTVS